MTLFRLKTNSYSLNYFGQGMAAATPCHMGSSATGLIGLNLEDSLALAATYTM